MTAPYLYSELPDTVDRHVARLLRETFLFYGECGHRNHVLYLDRASGAYGEVVTALALVIRAVRSYGGSLAFVTRRKDMQHLLSSSGLRKYVRIYQSKPVPSGVRRQKALPPAA